MEEYTPELDYNTYYTPNGKEGSNIKCNGRKYSFDTFAVWDMIDWMKNRRNGVKKFIQNSILCQQDKKLKIGFIRSWISKSIW